MYLIQKYEYVYFPMFENIKPIFFLNRGINVPVNPSKYSQWDKNSFKKFKTTNSFHRLLTVHT